jgi:acyl carrier protein
MSTPPTARAPDPLSRFPAAVRDSFARFRAGNPAELDPVLFAVVRDFMPRRDRAADGPLPDEARLIEDLGFDSLAIAEIVFFMEDLFQVKISNEEILQMRAVGELRTFVLHKLAATPLA